MFNVFKALKLYGIQQLPGIGRPAGPGSIPVDDWHADYEDYLVANQNAPTATTGGGWVAPQMDLSCCETANNPVYTAIGELILAPTALIPPDPTLFSTIGLSPASDVNPPGTSHTVTGTALSSGKQPVPGVTINFQVISGPNMGKSGSDTTDLAGQAHFTYDDDSVGPYPEIDTIQAFIGTLGSNQVIKTWALATIECDMNGDDVVDTADLLLIRGANGQPAASNPTYDVNGDGRINVLDVRYCQLRLTPAPI
jgi:hypothetical protein